jgi:hypothetical protein
MHPLKREQAAARRASPQQLDQGGLRPFGVHQRDA